MLIATLQTLYTTRAGKPTNVLERAHPCTLLCNTYKMPDDILYQESQWAYYSVPIYWKAYNFYKMFFKNQSFKMIFWLNCWSFWVIINTIKFYQPINSVERQLIAQCDETIWIIMYYLLLLFHFKSISNYHLFRKHCALFSCAGFTFFILSVTLWERECFVATSRMRKPRTLEVVEPDHPVYRLQRRCFLPILALLVGLPYFTALVNKRSNMKL